MDAIADLQTRLQLHAKSEKKAWWDRYLKGAADFRGVAMADVRRELHDWHRRHDLGARSAADQAEVATALIRETLTEDKLAGVLYFQEILIPGGSPACSELLPGFAALFDDGHLADWNSVDWFCVKVLGPLIQRDGAECGRTVAAWRDGATLWQRRASAVGFVNLVKRETEVFDGMRALVIESCAVLVRSSERFSQSGAGWVLREMSQVDPRAVEAFLREHGDRMSSDARRMASRLLSGRH